MVSRFEGGSVFVTKGEYQGRIGYCEHEDTVLGLAKIYFGSTSYTTDHCSIEISELRIPEYYDLVRRSNYILHKLDVTRSIQPSHDEKVNLLNEYSYIQEEIKQRIIEKKFRKAGRGSVLRYMSGLIRRLRG